MKSFVKASVVPLLIWAGCLVLGAQELEAQERIRLDGWVQWMSGTRMQVMTDRGTVAVDLREAEQASYQALRPGDRVLIEGVVASDRSRVMARAIGRDGGERGSGGQAP